jgi:hypothetical protein
VKFLIDQCLRKRIALIIFILMSSFLFSQNGTYELRNKNGSYCYVSLQKNGRTVKAEIFAWWNTPGGRTGSYSGKSQSVGNQYVLKSDENDPDCKVALILNKNTIKANFDRCTTDNLPTDFDGTYHKITNATAGDYIVSVPKSYFYQKPDAGSRQKTYLIKGNRVTLNIDSITAGNWVDVYYINPQNKEYRGYVLLSDLKKIPD